jgi:hypothetical protein
MVNVLGSPIAALIGAAWIALVATTVIVFRRRIANFLLRLATPLEDTAAQRRDITIGVVLLAVFALVLAATLATMFLLPSDVRPWPLAVGIPAIALLGILYSVRFSNAGLSVTGWLRR